MTLYSEQFADYLFPIRFRPYKEAFPMTPVKHDSYSLKNQCEELKEKYIDIYHLPVSRPVKVASLSKCKPNVYMTPTSPLKNTVSNTLGIKPSTSKSDFLGTEHLRKSL